VRAAARLVAVGAALTASPLGSPSPCVGAEFELFGFAEARAVRAPAERGWLDGGLGKLRFDGGGGSPGADLFHEVSLVGVARPRPDLSVVAHLRHAPDQDVLVEPIEAFARWRPVSTGLLRFSARAGAFFPPVSLENEGVGWTALWTLTPSAINSWIGEEVRAVGAEATVERRGDRGAAALTLGAFGWNDPAGILLAYRGWSFHDRWTGLLSRQRLPDEIALHMGVTPPVGTAIYSEIDDRPGLYGGLRWTGADGARLALLRYDNRADSDARKGDLAWRTRFWSAGAEAPVGGAYTAVVQAMAGDTTVGQGLPTRSETDFRAAFALLGWQRGDWRLAGRVDLFSTTERNQSPAPELSENGRAMTLAATWRPLDALRLTAEALRVVSDRGQREAVGVARRQEETLLQLSARWLF